MQLIEMERQGMIDGIWMVDMVIIVFSKRVHLDLHFLYNTHLK